MLKERKEYHVKLICRVSNLLIERYYGVQKHFVERISFTELGRI